MVKRHSEAMLAARLRTNPAVAILGPRQCGKTTLALRLAKGYKSVYLDLESPRDRARLADPEAFFLRERDKLVILDEVQRVPELFTVLRGMIDMQRRRGGNAGHYLLLGSASRELLRQSESLAGRIAYVELGPFSVMETPASRQTALWVQGGFPKSFLNSEGQSMFWRDHFIRTYLERDVPTLGPRIPATTLRNFWTMLAHNQGGVFNASELARSLDVDGKTVVRYLDVLTDLMLVRRLQPYFVNVGKPLVKVPRVFVRDSGIVHALLQVKLGETSRPERGFYQAAKDIRADRRFLVNPGTSPGGFANPEVELMGMRKMAALLAAMERKPGAPAGESRRAGR